MSTIEPYNASAVEVDPEIAEDLKAYVPLVGFLSEVFGEDTEVILHDLRDLNQTIVAISNSVLSGRHLRDSATRLMLTILSNRDIQKRGFVVDYESRARTGALFRSHAMFIRDDQDAIIGMLSINSELRKLKQAQDLIERLTRTVPVPGAMSSEQMNITPQEMTEEAIEAELASAGIHPSAMTPADKFKVLQNLFEMGIFLMRGSVPRAAQALELSEPSVYRYLTAVRKRAREGAS